VGSVNISFFIFPIRLGRRHHPPLIEHRPNLLKGFREGEEKIKKQQTKTKEVNEASPQKNIGNEFPYLTIVQK
jgi:hypothetical protein